MKIDNFKETTKNALVALGFDELSSVQHSAIPLALKKKNIVVQSQTGTGKTHTFLIPIFENIDSKILEVYAVIVSPTRELATQIYQMALQMNDYRETKIEIKLFTGGTDRKKELDYLNNNTPQIVIATPGKLYDLAIKEKKLPLYQTKVFVIDEADMTLDGGFIDEMHEIASLMPKNLQMMTFSATMNKDLEHFLKKYMDNPQFINIDERQLTNENIEHILIKTRYKDKYTLLGDLLNTMHPYLGLIFCNTKNSSEKLFAKLKEDGYNVCLINGNQPQRIRKQIMRRIKNLDFTYVVATDIAARGIDILDVSHVINYELPSDVEFYVHRSGRTARQDKKGVCISFYEFENYDYLDKLELLKVNFTFKEIKNKELVEAKTRNERKKRVVVDQDLKTAKTRVAKDKKVKPGYKKKYQAKLQAEVDKIKKRKRKKR